MKLTSESAARLGRHESRGFPVSDFDFKPDDFDGCFQNGKDHIILTVEEAKAVNEAIEWLCSTLEDYEREHDNAPALIEGWNQMDLLDSRIEQAEGKR